MVKQVRRDDARRLHAARIIKTVRGTEVRCPEHDHLLGVLNEAGQLVIKCRRDEYVIVEVESAK